MKKLILGVVGIGMVAGLLFGSNLMPYAQTAYDKASRSIEQQVPISFQIDAAKKQLENIGPEIDDMNLQIAKENVRTSTLVTSSTLLQTRRLTRLSESKKSFEHVWQFTKLPLRRWKRTEKS